MALIAPVILPSGYCVVLMVQASSGGAGPWVASAAVEAFRMVCDPPGYLPRILAVSSDTLLI